MKKIIVVALALCVTAVSCSDPQSRAKGVYMLLDTSGTYALELKKAQSIINYLLGVLQPGDTLAVARIDTGSFSEKDIVAKVTFDERPSVANNQKRSFQQKVKKFVSSVKSSNYTDITGGILQAIEYLEEQGSGQKYILIFSDLKQDLAKGSRDPTGTAGPGRPGRRDFIVEDQDRRGGGRERRLRDRLSTSICCFGAGSWCALPGGRRFEGIHHSADREFSKKLDRSVYQGQRTRAGRLAV